MSYPKVNSGGARNNNLKRILHFLLILVVYSCLITSSTYAYLYLGSNNNSISGSGKCEGVNYKGENISASNLVSTTNYLEGAKSTITLSKNKDCTIYTYVNLYLYTNNTTTAPITTVKALKYKIVSSNNVTYSGVVSYMEDTLLATLPLEDTEITYTIYLYIDSTLSLGNYNDKTYSGYIYATTEQTSTIGKNEDNTKKNLGLQTIDFDYLGSEQQFIVPQTGTYQLETWGASGGNSNEFGKYIGGYGGYSFGDIKLVKNKNIYLNIGGVGESLEQTYNGNYSNRALKKGGYNGGGSGWTGGGGATHLSFSSGILSKLKGLNQVIIVSGSGGGAATTNAGHGGGYCGTDAKANAEPYSNSYGRGGNQISGGIHGISFNDSLRTGTDGDFGIGGNDKAAIEASGGGAGYYGGGSGSNEGPWDQIGSGGGGSGYIGNSSLTNKAMYCYNCEESTEESTKTISTTLVSETPVSKYAKIGNGYAKITVID